MLQYSGASAAEDADVVGGDGRSPSSLRCDYCLLTADRDDGRPREELLVCFCCMAKAHPSCMHYSDELAARTRRSPWQCIDCKTCSVCGDPGDADAMLFCDACDKGYHMACHDPRIPEKPNGKWICRRCQKEHEEQQPAVQFHHTDHAGLHSSCRCTVDGTPGLPTPCHSPILDAGHHGSSQVESMSISDGGRNVSMLLLDVPDASDWSIEDIEKYFASIGFPEDAKAFREQEIDGRSLFLLKRNDVLSGLGLKLGPALKIYSHVRRLQMKHEMTTTMTTQQSFKG